MRSDNDGVSNDILLGVQVRVPAMMWNLEGWKLVMEVVGRSKAKNFNAFCLNGLLLNQC